MKKKNKNMKKKNRQGKKQTFARALLIKMADNNENQCSLFDGRNQFEFLY